MGKSPAKGTGLPGKRSQGGRRPETTGSNPLDSSSGLFELNPDEPKTVDPEQVVERARHAGRSGSTTSALSAFQRSAERFPPLGPAEQLALVARHRENAERIERLRRTNRSRDAGKLKELAREQDRIIEHLCASCWKLAWLIVREQAEERFGKDRATEMLPDLIAEANYALVKAALDFDPRQTPKFATYAARVIRDHTRAVLGRDGYMRLAPSWGRVKRLAATRMPEMTQELGRKPTIEELQEDLTNRCLEWALDHLTPQQQRLPMNQRKKLALAKLRKQGMLGAIRDIEDILVVSQTVVSLDSPLGEDGGSTLGDTVAYQDPDRTMDGVESAELHGHIMDALAALTDREREIVLLRYGFDGSEGWTYSAIAERHGVSSERIRQIERGALEKLAAPGGGFEGLLAYLRH